MSSTTHRNKEFSSGIQRVPKIDKVIATGAAIITLAAGAALYKVHEAGKEAGPQELSSLAYDRSEDHTVFGFAARHLKGDPRQYIDQLREQLPVDAQSNYNVPDGFVFHVDAEDVVQAAGDKSQE